MIAWAPMQVARAAPVEAVVHARRTLPPPGATRVEARTAGELAGTQGDPARAVESMPGAGRASFNSGALILWGAPPSRSQVYLDGVPVPRLFHGGGLRSTVQGFFLDAMELAPGAFGVEYGRATGGALMLSSAALDGSRAVASVDLLDASFAASRALDDRTTVAVGARAGYAADVLRALAPAAVNGLVDLPRYGDYQARFDRRFDARSTLSLFAFGSRDGSSLALPADDPTRPRSLARDASYHRLVATYTRLDDGGARTVLRAWAGVDASSRRERVGAVLSADASQRTRGGLRASHTTALSPAVTLRAGLDAEVGSTVSEREGSLSRPPREGDVYVLGQPAPDDARADRWVAASALAGLWCELPVSLDGDRITLVPGLRIDLDALTASRLLPPLGDTPPRGVSRLTVSVQPRLAMAVRAARAITLRASVGRYHAPPDAADLSAVFGNPTLDGTSAWHAVVGLRVAVANALEVSADAFLRTESEVASRVAAPFAGEALANTGSTDTVGLQSTVRVTAARVSGWLTYTLLRSTVRDREGATERLSDYDQTHLFTAVASVALGRGWRIGARARVASGAPRTAVVARTLDALSGDYEPVFGARNGDRLPTFVSVDARLDKTFRVGAASVTVFVDVLNALDRANAEEVVYDPAFRLRSYVTGAPLVADVGLRGEL